MKNTFNTTQWQRFKGSTPVRKTAVLPWHLLVQKGKILDWWFCHALTFDLYTPIRFMELSKYLSIVCPSSRVPSSLMSSAQNSPQSSAWQTVSSVRNAASPPNPPPMPSLSGENIRPSSRCDTVRNVADVPCKNAWKRELERTRMAYQHVLKLSEVEQLPAIFSTYSHPTVLTAQKVTPSLLARRLLLVSSSKQT